MMLLLFIWVGLAAAESLKLDFIKTSVLNPVLRPRALGLPLYNDLPHQRYLVNLTVGTPPQPFALTVDTGSADLWVPSANSTGCAPNCPPHTFDPSKSRTYKTTGLPFNATYGLTPDLQVTGPYFNDTLHIGRAVIPNMTLGFGNVPPELFVDGIYGLVGLGSRYGESIINNPSSPDFRNPNATFPVLYDQLYMHGYIHQRLFSIWLNDADAKTGSILFGGIDHSKYDGTLEYVPVVTAGPPPGIFTDWAVNLTSVTRDSPGRTSQPLPLPGGQITTIFDSGSPNMYLPVALADAVAKDMNATTSQGFPYVDCQLRHAPQSLTFGFGPSGPKISVPYKEIIYPFGDPANIGDVRAPDGSRLCYLGLIGTNGTILLLGDTFIRAAYVVYDVDNLRIGMAPVRYH